MARLAADVEFIGNAVAIDVQLAIRVVGRAGYESAVHRRGERVAGVVAGRALDLEGLR